MFKTPHARNRALFYIGFTVGIGIISAGWWLGNHDTLSTMGDRLTAIGRLFGLLTAYSVLLQLFLMARTPLIEKNFDLHDTVDLHRWNGYAILATISAHVSFITLGYAAPGKIGLWHQFIELNTSYEDVFKATIGAVMIFGIAGISAQLIRSRLRYEVWYVIHLGMYLAILLAFLHQIKIGTDLITQKWFLIFWYALYLFIFGLIGYYRFGQIFFNEYRFKFRLDRIEREADDIYSFYIKGKNIQKFKYNPGQYAGWRILSRDTWYEAHPFSISIAPGKNHIRFTCKTTGDFGQNVLKLKGGEVVLVDGPRGSFTTDRMSTKNAVMIAGGIGITPFIANMPTLLKNEIKTKLIYSVRNPGQLAFRNELADLRQKGVSIDIFDSEKGQMLNAESLQEYIAQDTTYFVCGPPPMSRSIIDLLQKAGIDKDNILTERFSF